MEKVIKDGKVAVLYSPGFGAGWYSENRSHPECLFHPEIIKLVQDREDPKCLDNSEEIYKKAKELFGNNFFSGGEDGLVIVWLKEGSYFKIHVYDGYESIDIFCPSMRGWNRA